MGAVSISVALCCLAAEKSRGLARETAESFLLLFKGVNAENCQQAQVPFLHCLGAVAYRPGVKQVQGLYQFNGRAGGGRQGMREVGASARLSWEGCGRGADGVWGWQPQEGQRWKGRARLKKAGGL